MSISLRLATVYAVILGRIFTDRYPMDNPWEGIEIVNRNQCRELDLIGRL